MHACRSTLEDPTTAAFKSKAELYTIGIFKRDGSGGHAVTPFAIQKEADGTVSILIYDNNWPNDTRKIVVDPAKNTWSYNAATNPNEPTELYEGDAQTASLSLLPTLPGVGEQPCPFCGAATTAERRSTDDARPRYDTYYLNGDPRFHPDLVVTDKRGRRSGYVKGKLVNQIPGARIIRPLLGIKVWKSDPSPEIRIPTGQDVTVKIDGSRLKKASTSGFGLILRGRNLGVRDIQLHPGQASTLEISGHGTGLAYTSDKHATGKPVFDIGYEGVGVDRSFTIAATKLHAGSTVKFELDNKDGTLRIDASDVDGGFGYDLDMERIDDQGVHEFSSSDLSLTGDEAGTLTYEDWTDDNQDPPVAVEETG